MQKPRREMRTLLKIGIAAMVVAGIAVGVTMTTSGASATPGETGDCDSCHHYPATTLRVSTDVTAKTVAPGGSFVVNITWSGGATGYKTEVNWPSDAVNNALFNPTPRIPYPAGSQTSGTTSSMLTAPTTPGDYTIKVYATKRNPMETYYAQIAVTVATPPATYTITASSGGNGTVTPAGVTTVNSGGSQVCTIAPDTGFHVADVLVDGSSVGAVTGYTFSNITTNHTISATFAANQPVHPATYTITASSGGNGTVTPAGVTTVNSGGSQAYTIAPGTGFHVADVLVDGSSVGAVRCYTFSNVTANHTISVTFVRTNGYITDDENDDHRGNTTDKEHHTPRARAENEHRSNHRKD